MRIQHLTNSGPDSAVGLSAGVWSRHALLGLPVLLAVAGCVNTDPFLEEDEAVADALTSEPMWGSYRPAWVESESEILGRRRGGNLAGESRVMISNRFLYGVVPPDAIATAQAAAVQAGWTPPDGGLQGRWAQGSGKAVLLRLFISAADGSLGITINGSFG